MKKQGLTGLETKVLGAIKKYPGCNYFDLRNLLNRLAVYDATRVLLNKKLIKAKIFPEETINRYYPANQKMLKKRKPVLNGNQRRILKVIKDNPSTSAWKLKAILNNGLSLWALFRLPYLIKTGLVRTERRQNGGNRYYAR